MSYLHYYFFFFFQAEDGIRGFHVTGVQTCALPIYIKGEKGKYQLVVSEKAWKSLKMRVKTITAKTKPMSFDERSEEHTSELQSREKLVCRLVLEKKKQADGAAQQIAIVGVHRLAKF